MRRNSEKIARVRVHASREDRALTAAGKTKNSKVRSEGRALAAQERAAEAKQQFMADRIKGVL